MAAAVIHPLTAVRTPCRVRWPTPRCVHRHGRRQRTRGAVALWFLATAVAVALAAFTVLNVGALSASRQHLAAVADAAAFSGAAAQARTLNFTAYANRTVVANEVLVAQLVSVDSWVRYVDKLVTNASRVTFWIPGLNAVMQTLKQVADAAARGVSAAARLIVPATSALDQALAAAIDAAYFSAPVAAHQAANASLEGSPFIGPDGQMHRAGLHPTTAESAATFNTVAFGRLSKRYSGDERGRIRQVVMDSRDPFTQRRPGNGLTHFDVGLVALHKTSGKTEMEGFDRWVGQDTLDVTGLKRLRGPLAWGRASGAEQATNGNYWCGPNHPVERSCAGMLLSYRWAWYSTDRISGYQGLPALRDVADTGERDPAVRFVVPVALDQAALVSPDTASAASSASLPSRLLGERLQTVAMARVAFVRPQRSGDRSAAALGRADGAVEYGNLFNPYWQARLAPLSRADRLLWMTPMGAPLAYLLAQD